MSPKKETINPNFYFLGSILNTYDIEKTTTRTPTLDDGRDQIDTITVPSNRGLEDEKNLMAKKSLPTNKLIKAYQKKNPPSYLFPLDLDGSSNTIDPTNKNIDPYIPLSLPHDNPY